MGPAGWGGDWDMGTVWRLCEYKGVSEGNILPSTPLTHTTTPHTLRDPRGRSPRVIENQVYYWGQVQENGEGHPHPLSCRSEGTLQYLERGNCSITGSFPQGIPCHAQHLVAVNSITYATNRELTNCMQQKGYQISSQNEATLLIWYG